MELKTWRPLAIASSGSDATFNSLVPKTIPMTGIVCQADS